MRALLRAGQPWAAASLPNGDLVTVSSQASRKSGHVYVWTADPARASTDEMLLSRFATDMKPPPKPKPSAEEGAGGGGGLPEGVKISGAYESRDQLAGSRDGQYGFFRRADGAVMACAWSAAAGEGLARAQRRGGASSRPSLPPPSRRVD